MIKWDISATEHRLIQLISVRAAATAALAKAEVFTVGEMMMDITAAHANGCELKLEELLAAPETDFVHDVFGVRRHINRSTGKLEDYFLPRYAKENSGSVGQARQK